MTVIKTHNEKELIANECCICGGIASLFISGSAFIVANGKEYRVYYHKACLTPETKKMVEQKLQQMVIQKIG